MKRARTWLVAIACLSTLGGFIAGVFADGAAANHFTLGGLITFPLYVFTYLWMKADAHERATTSPPGAIPLVVGFFPLAVPYHLVATRRGWRKALSLLGFLGFIVLAFLLNEIGAEAGWWLAN